MKKILFIILLFCIRQVNAQVCLNPAVNFAVGCQPNFVITADFNGDGKEDLATANTNSDSLSVLLGTGTGSFSPATSYTGCSIPRSICSADFNGDGKADLAGASNGSDEVSVYLGTGTGSFGTANNFVVSNTAGAFSVISADFNGDGKVDLAATTDSIAILLGTGTGSFGTAIKFAAGIYPISLSSADFNGDSKADLAVANNTGNNIFVFLGTGTGSFAFADSFAVGTNPLSVISSDFNGDGKKDLAVANDSSYNVSVLLGTGTGSFGTATNFAAGSQPHSVISADVNGDGKKDLVLANRLSNNVSVLLGTGAGSFGAASNFLVGTHPFCVAITDFNGDGKEDLAVSNASPISNNVSVLVNCTPTSTCVASVTDSMYKDIMPLTWDIVPHYATQVNNAKWHWGDGTSTTGLYPSHTYTASGWYSICVTVYTSCGDSASACRNDSIYRIANNSSMVHVNILQNPNSINQITNNINELSIYPNPSNNNFTIQSSMELGVIIIYNSLGETVLQTKSKNLHEQIDISKLSKGIYIVQARGRFGKLIKE